MKKLVAADMKRFESFRERLEKSKTELDEIVERFNEQILLFAEKQEQANKAIYDALEAHNVHIADFNVFREGVAADIQEFMNQRPEGWFDTESGQECQEWWNQWDSSLEELEFEVPDAIECIDMEEPEALEDLFPTNR